MVRPVRGWPVRNCPATVRARTLGRQVADVQIGAAILNGFTVLGIPRTVAIG
jgi:hypothetical protein